MPTAAQNQVSERQAFDVRPKTTSINPDQFVQPCSPFKKLTVEIKIRGTFQTDAGSKLTTTEPGSGFECACFVAGVGRWLPTLSDCLYLFPCSPSWELLRRVFIWGM